MRSYHGYCGKLALEWVLGAGLSRLLALLLALASVWRLWPLRRCAVPSREFGYAVALLLSIAVAISFTIPFMIYNDILLLPGCVLLLLGPGTSRGLAGFTRRFAQVWLAWAFLSVPAALLARTLWSPPLQGDKLALLNPFLSTAVVLFLLFNPPVRQGESAGQRFIASREAGKAG